MIFTDSHLHTHLSYDAKGTLLEKAEVAASKGVGAITVTDHFECHNPEKWTSPKIMKEEYSNQTKLNKTSTELLFGIELGEPNLNPLLAAEIVKDGGFDLVIASVHVLEDCLSISQIDYGSPNLKGDIGRYLSCIEDIVQNSDFDTLAHINMTARYAAMAGISLSMEPYYNRLYKIFKNLVEREKALEINMSSLYSPLKAPLPTKDVLQLYKEAGGEILTVGSDAHTVDQTGRGIKEAYEYIKEAGFNKIALYRKRKPQFIYI